MSISAKVHIGHYDTNGHWRKDKNCFVYCGADRCDCGPPGGQHYSVIHDQRTVPLETQNAPDDVNMGIEQDEFDV